MDVVAISNLRANLPSLVGEVSDKLKRLIVTVSGKPKAVMIGLEEFESLEETAEILAVPGAYEKITKGIAEAKKGKGVPLSKLK
ncbi:type II toxin-antitoxin system Phd/YefM family antitoxin [Candidatus Microgenomates bacterium]|nr:type II toxin-antitoxin system Phd/YefM family antitoxin [Candidatus Microgenomates bacterium]